MAKEITTEIQINAPVEKVWEAFSAFDQYGEWNPFIKSITGQVDLGQKIGILLNLEGKKPMTFKPKVLAFEPNKELIWVGRVLMPGVFDGRHSFVLIDNGDGTTTFKQFERFSGILVPLFGKKFEASTKQGFEEMNLALKKQVEQH